MKLFDLTGKVAIVTGSSRGIGKASAEALADHGAKVVISSRKQDACDEVAAAINAKHGAGTAIAVAASISDKAALQNLVDETRRAFGRIDILVCNAASNPYYGPLAGIEDDQFRKILDNNIISNHWLIQKIERDGALHVDVDLVTELHEILDGAEMDVRRVVPCRRQIVGARHLALHQQLEAHFPVAEIRKRHDGAVANAQQVFQHHARLARCLQGLRQDHVIERIVGIVDQIGVGVALHHRQSLGDAAVDALARQLDAAAVDAARFQQTKQIALAAADVEHPRAGLHHLRDQQMVGAIAVLGNGKNRGRPERVILNCHVSGSPRSGRARTRRIPGRRGRSR